MPESSNNTKRKYLSAPARVFLHLTERCNFNCFYCFVDANKTKPSEELTVKEFHDIFKQLNDLNVITVRLFGGEPLSRPDIIEILDLLKSCHFYSTLNTNGTFITNSIAQKLKEVNVSYIHVSFDGPKEIHEQMCGVKNSFEKTVDGILRLKKCGLRTGLEIVLTSLNMKYFFEALDIAADLKVDSFKILPLQLAGRADLKAGNYYPTYEEWKDFYLELTERKMRGDLPIKKVSITHFNCNFCSWELYYPLPSKKRKKILKEAWGIDLDHPTKSADELRCDGAINACAILANGDIYPCDMMKGIKHLKVGNIRNDSLKDIWQKSEVFNRLRSLNRKDLIGHCRDCENPFCSGTCQAAAYYTTGNILGSDIHCIKAGKP
jgi:radical SAM protein with 4Fe4S-binding SPASM domain